MPKKALQWKTIFKDMTARGIEKSFLNKREYSLGKDKYSATLDDNFMSLSVSLRDRLIERWIQTQQRYYKKNLKRVYYLSLEFLIGRLLDTNIINLGLEKNVKKAVKELGFNFEELCECEQDAGLGNGGLGRLAACFLDSMATLKIPACGYGIKYDFGIFNQKIINGYQVEFPEKWLTKGNPWEFQRLENAVRIQFYGKSSMVFNEKGNFRMKWTDTVDVLAVPYDMPIPGYKNNVVNTLRLWSARSTNEFNFKYFDEGNYEAAVYDKMSSENISKVLYPNDNSMAGKELRLKQEYFFTAASVSDILRRFRKYNSDFRKLPQKAVIQINDTHPSLAIVECMRLLVDEHMIEWDKAWEITVKVFAYTNHTVMAEALEKWDVELFGKLLPRHLEIIYEINKRFLQEVARKFHSDDNRLQRMSIISQEYGRKIIKMSFLAIVGSNSINGVSELHTKIIKEVLFKDFYEMFPHRFNNKTNGITPRRWLLKANPRLSLLIEKKIGSGWHKDLAKLNKLLSFAKNSDFCEKWDMTKQINKKDLADYIYKTTSIKVNPLSMFDVQVKRFHEYKRQLLFALFIISEYLKIKNDKTYRENCVPRTFIIAGKSAPGYVMAKLIIKFINDVACTVNNDKAIGDKLKVVFLENYNVSLAEKIFPASDLSEQISTSGREASGTGCMKFMLNGALTIGTFDGANIEIAKAVGDENIFLFGLKHSQIEDLTRNNYNPQKYINDSRVLGEVIQFIKNFKSQDGKNIFDPILDNITKQDPFFICADFDSYLETQQKISSLYLDRKSWIEKSIINTACCGEFSSDRTIKQYAKEIWGVPCEQ